MLTDRHKGILLILMSSLGFSVMNLFVPLAGDLPAIQKSFFRNILAALVAIIVLLIQHRKEPKKELTQPGKLPWGTLILRSTLGTIGMIANYYTLDHLLIADASVLNKISPFATLIFSAIFLGERLDRSHLYALAFAFVGVLFVVKPTLASTAIFPYLVGLVGGICAGAAYTTVRQLNLLGVDGSFTIAFFSAFSSLVSLPYILVEGEAMTGYQVFILLMASLGAVFGQYGMTFAYKYAPASEISIFDYSGIVFTGILGFLFLNQVPDWLSLVGYAFIFLGALLNFLYNRHLARKKL